MYLHMYMYYSAILYIFSTFNYSTTITELWKIAPNSANVIMHTLVIEYPHGWNVEYMSMCFLVLYLLFVSIRCSHTQHVHTHSLHTYSSASKVQTLLAW